MRASFENFLREGDDIETTLVGLAHASGRTGTFVRREFRTGQDIISVGEAVYGCHVLWKGEVELVSARMEEPPWPARFVGDVAKRQLPIIGARYHFSAGRSRFSYRAVTPCATYYLDSATLVEADNGYRFGGKTKDIGALAAMLVLGSDVTRQYAPIAVIKLHNRLVRDRVRPSPELRETALQVQKLLRARLQPSPATAARCLEALRHTSATALVEEISCELLLAMISQRNKATGQPSVFGPGLTA